MQFTTAFAAFVALASATLASAGPVVEARAESIFYCGKQPYRKSEVSSNPCQATFNLQSLIVISSQYTCYPKNGNLLCPIVNGVVYFPCGWGKTGACYDPSNYGCKNGKLYLLDNCGGVVYDHNSVRPSVKISHLCSSCLTCEPT